MTTTTERDAWWHCRFCGDHERVEPPYEVGDKEPWRGRISRTWRHASSHVPPLTRDGHDPGDEDE